MSPLYAFTSLVSLTVVFGIWCFMFPTLNRSRPRHDSGEEFASSYQPLSKPSIPPCSPHETQVSNSCLHLPTSYHLPLVPSLVHHTSCPFKPSLSMDVMIIILPITWSYPLFPHSVGSRHSAQSCNCRFLLAQRPCLFLFCVQIAAFPPVCGLVGWGCCFSS